MQYKLRARNAKTEQDLIAAWLWGGRRFCELVARTLDQRFDAVFAFSSAAKELFESARTRGLLTVLDHATAPLLFEHRLIQEERERFPDWSERAESGAALIAYNDRQLQEIELADVVLCGSSFVRDAILAGGSQPEKVRVVPLGLHDRFFSFSRNPTASDTLLRVLFVGDDGLRKGIGYLSAAAEALSGKIQVKAVGKLQLNAKGRAAVGKFIELTGPIPRRNMEQMFRWADLLVLPSVSDTFGLVILEAMAAGLPVIATRHTCAPEVLRDGVDGFVVPLRDPIILAERLEKLADDRELLQYMATNARQRASEFTLTKYADRLAAALA
jgi:glycosyltransferase involved in cell wall biosynthesis